MPAGKNSPETFVADFAVFDPATGKATALAPLQEARGNAQVCIDPPGRRLLADKKRHSAGFMEYRLAPPHNPL